MTTVWPARRVGDRILCGRPAPDGGCRGEIATVARRGQRPDGVTGTRREAVDLGDLGQLPTGWREVEVVVLPSGMVEDPPGSGFWRPTARARGQAARGQRPTGDVRAEAARRPRGEIFGEVELPIRRACPVCNVIAAVGRDVIRS